MKTDRIYIRISELEKQKFQEMAKRLGISLSEFIRLACNDKIKECKDGIRDKSKSKLE